MTGLGCRPLCPRPSDETDEYRHALHSGIGGLALTLAEVRLTRTWSTTESELAAGIANSISTGARQRLEPSYFAGLAGDVVALRALAPGSEDGAMRRLHEIATPAGMADDVVPPR